MNKIHNIGWHFYQRISCGLWNPDATRGSAAKERLRGLRTLCSLGSYVLKTDSKIDKQDVHIANLVSNTA